MGKNLLAVFICSVVSFGADILLIRGEEVAKEDFPQIVDIRTGNSGCTATVVGPKVIVTAAHCVGNGERSTFEIDGVRHQTVGIRHPKYPRVDVDVALGVSQNEFGVEPYSIGNVRVVKGEKIDLFGYGCIREGGGGGNDGILRAGESTITGFSGHDFVFGSGKDAALCYGDSGGPAFSGLYQVGVNSKGNISSRSYDLDLTHPEVQSWLKDVAETKKVEICGITNECP